VQSTNHKSYRGDDRRAQAISTGPDDARRAAQLLAGVAAVLLIMARLGSPATRLLLPLTRLDEIGGALAVIAGVALLLRWRLDGRALSWWTGLALIVLGTPGLADTGRSVGGTSLPLASLTVALVFFVISRRSAEVDTRLTSVRAALVLLPTLVVTFALSSGFTSLSSAMNWSAAALALAYGALALAWYRDSKGEPWLLLPLFGLALLSALALLVPEAEVRAGVISFMGLVTHLGAAAGALVALHASATSQRALALRELREREESEARFADTLHEVRSTVVALEGGIRTLQPNSDAPPARSELARAMESELHRLRLLVDPQQADENSVCELREAMEPLMTIATARGWPMRWDIERDVYVRARAVDVAQIVHGLLSNATRYAPGETIDVTVLTMPDRAVIAVEDGGMGIPPENRERIFERGERAIHAATPDGSGLGLHIARRLARSLDGDLWASESFSGGARFVLLLPTVSVDLFGEAQAS
jgi:signal transduction histidine kinase